MFKSRLFPAIRSSKALMDMAATPSKVQHHQKNQPGDKNGALLVLSLILEEEGRGGITLSGCADLPRRKTRGATCDLWE